MPSSPLLDSVRQAIRLRHYSYRIEKAYADWILRYILFHGKRHPREMGGPEVTEFLSHLANRRQVTAASQAQALAAWLFLYKHVLKVNLPWLGNVFRAGRPKRLPLILTRSEVGRIMTHLYGRFLLLVGPLYGSGLCVLESLRLVLAARNSLRPLAKVSERSSRPRLAVRLSGRPPVTRSAYR